MNLPAYKIELRQIEVKGLNARHYFWVLKKRQPDGKFSVVSELHGGAENPKTGEMKSFSVGGDRLKYFNFPGDNFHKNSHKLPFAIAVQGSKENVMARWNQGVQAGKIVNKSSTK